MIYSLTITAVIWALGVTASMLRETRRDRGQTRRPLPRGGKTYPIYPFYLPFGLGFFALVMLIWPGPSVLYMIFKISFLPAILLISAYHSLLYFSLPLIRRLFSSRAIIALWIIPNVLYYFVIHAVQPARRLYVTLPAEWFSRLSGLWFAGFSAVMVWFIVSHLRYRTNLLTGAGPASPELSNRWQAAQTRFAIKHPIPALVHPAITSPLTIGCFSRTMRLVLPDKDYSELDLDLIFSHELTHIQRLDAGTKFFMIFCKALAWFNPLSWLTASQVARDIELSADEAVLTGADQALRRHYAGLIIHNAGCPGGFTTCLSASAESLRYRLQQIMAPRRRLSGVILIGLTTFLLIMSLGRIGLLDRPKYLTEHVSASVTNQLPAEVIIQAAGEKVSFPGDSHSARALIDYLNSLSAQEVYQIGSVFNTFSDQSFEGDSIYLMYQPRQTAERLPRTAIRIGSRFIVVEQWDKDLAGRIWHYRLNQPLDWAAVWSRAGAD